MPQPQQLLLPFASLDFLGRNGAVTLGEIARKLGGSIDHYSHLVDDGTLVACDLARHVGSRRMLRVPLEEYRRFVSSRLTGARRSEFFAELPPPSRLEIAAECIAHMTPQELAELLRRHSAA